MKRILVISTIAALLVMLALPALCDLRVSSRPTGDVIIGNEVVLTIHAAAGGMSIQQRVDQVITRLNKWLGSDDFDPALISIRKVGSEYAVTYKGELIVTADTNTAKLNGTTTEKLANKWAANLKRVIPLAKATPGDN